ncbi:MAG: NAD(P)-dependent oxidoreductase [Acetobacteraceae bacterium]|nr:NAD(P)-dependent oxidoreductase [Acetobacteraceae bacterium]
MRVLVTGGQGFLGAWIIRRLHAGGHRVRVFDLGRNTELVERIAGTLPEWVTGDVADPAQVLDAARGCDAIIHLAGILTPACAADPKRGAEINLIGTINVFEAARALGISQVVYTSSAAAFGPEPGAPPFPVTHYGAFKLACEGCARAYWEEQKIASIGFRPYIVYGPGRETGLTAGPSLACKAAARGEDYTIGYTGESGLIYVDDVAAAYEAAVLGTITGAHVFNLEGVTISTADFAAEIQRQVQGAAIAVTGPNLPLPAKMLKDNLSEVLPGLPTTSVADGIAATVTFYRD